MERPKNGTERTTDSLHTKCKERQRSGFRVSVAVSSEHSSFRVSEALQDG